MQRTQVYHGAKTDGLDSILSEGLKCEAKASGTQEDFVQKTDEILLRHRPAEFERVDRQRALYAYLFLESSIIDTEDGRQLAPDEWRVEEGRSRLRLTINPESAYMSDLEAYDKLAAAVREGRDDEYEELARAYWEHLAPLDRALADFTLDPSGFGVAGRNSNERYRRVEVILTADIAPDRIEALRG